jgi:hypothetical protein
MSNDVGRLQPLADLTGMCIVEEPAGKSGVLCMLVIINEEWNLTGSGAVDGGDGAYVRKGLLSVGGVEGSMLISPILTTRFPGMALEGRNGFDASTFLTLSSSTLLFASEGVSCLR